MTRYARAKGSKASNERTPNDATPWHVMKQQLTENLSKQEECSEKKSAKELLRDNTVTENNDWAEFNETSTKKGSSTIKQSKKKKKEGTSSVHENESSNKLEVCNKDKKEINNIRTEKKSSLKRNINDNNNCTTEIRVKKKQRDKYNDGKVAETSRENSDISQIKETGNNASTVSQMEGVLSKRQKRNMRKQQKNLSENALNTSESDKNSTNENKTSSRKENSPKKPKNRSDKEYKRRKEDFGPKEIILNGIKVEIAKFDGFPITKEDAERLHDLKQKMIMKGIPKKDIDIAMKLERRRAERTLARMRRSVCFHCRKGGHNLSDCPELSSQQVGTGICFKCGSTEHTHFECKVSKPTEFRYATCFICREQGHIAKQCPDNPKGVYPKGGCCKICGDVTHLKKDCPDLIKEKEENTVTVNTITNDNVESLEGNIKTVSNKDDKKSKKIVKF